MMDHLFGMEALNYVVVFLFSAAFVVLCHFRLNKSQQKSHRKWKKAANDCLSRENYNFDSLFLSFEFNETSRDLLFDDDKSIS